MKKLSVEITDLEWEAFADTVLDPQQWVEDAVRAKVNKCIGRVVKKEQQRLLDDPTVETIPATIDGILRSHLAQSDYKNRSEREVLMEQRIQEKE